MLVLSSRRGENQAHSKSRKELGSKESKLYKEYQNTINRNFDYHAYISNKENQKQQLCQEIMESLHKVRKLIKLLIRNKNLKMAIISTDHLDQAKTQM